MFQCSLNDLFWWAVGYERYNAELNKQSLMLHLLSLYPRLFNIQNRLLEKIIMLFEEYHHLILMGANNLVIHDTAACLKITGHPKRKRFSVTINY